jgi:hypothetical protein
MNGIWANPSGSANIAEYPVVTEAFSPLVTGWALGITIYPFTPPNVEFPSSMAAKTLPVDMTSNTSKAATNRTICFMIFPLHFSDASIDTQYHCSMYKTIVHSNRLIVA